MKIPAADFLAIHLTSSGHQLLLTRHGPLDLLGTIGINQGYEELIQHTVHMKIGEYTMCVLDLETLITVKEELGQEKDRASIPILKRTLTERSR